MRFFIGVPELVLTAAIALGAVTALDCSPPVGTALGVVLIPFVALITSSVGPWCSPAPGEAAPGEPPPPPRGLCGCGHVMSMHCHADCSGPCAAPGCRCSGRG